MKTKTGFHKLAAWLLTLAILLTLMPMSAFAFYVLRITGQPTAENPTCVAEYGNETVSYQWYKKSDEPMEYTLVENASALNEISATVPSSGYGTFSNGVWTSGESGIHTEFIVMPYDVITLTTQVGGVNSDIQYPEYIWGDLIKTDTGVYTHSATEEDFGWWYASFSQSNTEFTMTGKVSRNWQALDGETSGTLSTIDAGTYICMASYDDEAVFSNEITLMSPHSHYNCGVENCTADHGHSSVDNWTAWDGTGDFPGGNVYLTNTVNKAIIISTGEVNLCLNGNDITASNVNAISVSAGATLNICDCQTTAGSISATVGDSRGISNSGTVNIYGGSVSGLTYGVYASDKGDITISGGDVSASNSGGYGVYSSGSGAVKISGGTVSGKHGVYLYGTGDVTVSGGTVSGVGSTGYGIFLYSRSTGDVAVNGGTISGTAYGIYTTNGSEGSVAISGNADISGAQNGILHYGKGTVTVSGGKVSSPKRVTGTTSSGIKILDGGGNTTVSGGTVSGMDYGIYNGGTLELSGKPTITGNTAGIYFDGDYKITIGGALTNTTPISVKMKTLGTFTSGWADKMGDEAANYNSYFTSADSTYTVQPDGNGELKLAEPAPEARWGASADSLTGSGTLMEAFDAEGVKYIQLQSNVTYTEQTMPDFYGISDNDGLIFDFNGCTITQFENLFINRSTVTITDSKGGGGIVTDEESCGINIYEDAKVTIEGGSFSGGYCGVTVSDGTLDITGGEISVSDMGVWVLGGDGNIAGGEIHGGMYGVWVSAGNTAVSAGAKISGGEFGILIEDSDKVTLSGGDVHGELADIYFYTDDDVLTIGGTLSDTYSFTFEEVDLPDAEGDAPVTFATAGQDVTLNADNFTFAGLTSYDDNGNPFITPCNNLAVEVSEDGTKLQLVYRETPHSHPICGETAYSYLKYIDQNLRERIAGSDQEVAAAEYIFEQLESFGYAPEYQNFSYSIGSTTINSQNIIVTKPGKSEETIIVGAHYDSVGTAGVDDNGSGVSVVLETVKSLYNVETPYTIKFIFFGAEEQGLRGSKAYVSDMMTQEDIENTICMINIDSVLAGTYRYMYSGDVTKDVNGEVIVEKSWPFYQAMAISDEFNLGMRSNDTELNYDYPSPTTGTWSDHQSFRNKGIPYLYFEAANWELPDYPDHPNWGSSGAYETETGEVMHVKGRDDLTFIENEWGSRGKDTLSAYCKLLSELLVRINVPGSTAPYTLLNVVGEYEDESELESEYDGGYVHVDVNETVTVYYEGPGGVIGVFDKNGEIVSSETVSAADGKYKTTFTVGTTGLHTFSICYDHDGQWIDTQMEAKLICGDIFYISFSASPADGGTVTGDGTYEENAEVTVTATANDGYKFVKWTENGTDVSTNASYTFTATEDRNLVAVFEAIEYVTVNLQSPRGIKEEIKIDINSTVADLKAMVAAKCNVTFGGDSEYRLFGEDLQYPNSNLDDDTKVLSDIGFANGQTIHLEKSTNWDSSEEPVKIFGLTITGGKGSQEPYGDYNNVDYYWNYYHKTIIIKSSANITISGTGEHNTNIIIKKAGNSQYTNLTISDLSLTTDAGACIDVQGNSWVNLTIEGNNTLTATGEAAQYPVDKIPALTLTNSGAYLKIMAASTGTLTATTMIEGQPGIGTYDNTSEVWGVEINGGTIIANGGEGGAGIRAQAVCIYGGNVTANGGIDGYGSNTVYPYSIEIRGGTITASSESGKALSAAPNLDSYENYTAIASTNKNGTEAVAYDRAANDTYKYFKIEPRDAYNYDITISASPAEGGTVTGGGTYEGNAEVTVTATANDDYKFVKWTENGTDVSTNASYTFTATEDRNLVAVFEKYETVDITVNLVREEGNVPYNVTYEDGTKYYSCAKVTITKDGEEVYSESENADSEHSFIIISPELAIGTYKLTITKPGYITYTDEIEVTSGGNNTYNISLVPGDIRGSYETDLGDGIVDIDDFIRIIRGFDPDADVKIKNSVDINEDGNVNVTDLGYVKSNFGKNVNYAE